jgi:serine/threonine-protein kinase
MSIGRRRFRIIKEIAEGGFGKVYLAEQISSDGFSRIVAVKLLHAKWSSHDEVVMRTRDEARLLGLIRHQHIVKVEDLTAIDGKCAIVMEYLEGVDLKWMMQFLKDRDMVFPRAALFDITLAVASALDAAYNGTPLQGGDPLRVIHRDIKPSNIFVTVAGGVKVLDFGTARANFAEREAKTQALAFGSQGYMAPERMLGEEDTPAADIFSLGITLYELLSLESFGRIPPRPNKFAKKIEERVASIPLDGDPEWCDQVRDTLRLMMSYEPKERPSAAQLVEIMEILAQDAGDMQLRRYCRTLVAEAKASLPELDTGDPLAGTIVDEDASASFANAESPMPSAPRGGVPQPAGGASGRASSTGGRAATSAGGAAATEEGSGRVLGMAVASFGAVGLVSVGVLALVLVGILVWVLMNDSGSSVTPSPEPIAEQPVPAPEPEPELSGGRIVDMGSAAGPKIATTLTYSDGAGGEVGLKGPKGFTAQWDGKAPFDMGAVPTGRYVANVKTAAGKTHRLKRFEVKEGAASCTFAFDADAGEWTGACE